MMEGRIFVARVEVGIILAQRSDTVGVQQFRHCVFRHACLHRGRNEIVEGDRGKHQLIGADLGVAAAVLAQAIGHDLAIPIQAQEVLLRLGRECAPLGSAHRVPGLVGQGGTTLQGGVPQCLDLHRARAAGRPRLLVLDAGVHPGVGRIVPQQAIGVDIVSDGAVEIGHCHLVHGQSKTAVAGVANVLDGRGWECGHSRGRAAPSGSESGQN